MYVSLQTMVLESGEKLMKHEFIKYQDGKTKVNRYTVTLLELGRLWIDDNNLLGELMNYRINKDGMIELDLERS